MFGKTEERRMSPQAIAGIYSSVLKYPANAAVLLAGLPWRRQVGWDDGPSVSVDEYRAWCEANRRKLATLLDDALDRYEALGDAGVEQVIEALPEGLPPAPPAPAPAPEPPSETGYDAWRRRNQKTLEAQAKDKAEPAAAAEPAAGTYEAFKARYEREQAAAATAAPLVPGISTYDANGNRTS